MARTQPNTWQKSTKFLVLMFGAHIHRGWWTRFKQTHDLIISAFYAFRMTLLYRAFECMAFAFIAIDDGRRWVNSNDSSSLLYSRLNLFVQFTLLCARLPFTRVCRVCRDNCTKWGIRQRRTPDTERINPENAEAENSTSRINCWRWNFINNP